MSKIKTIQCRGLKFNFVFHNTWALIFSVQKVGVEPALFFKLIYFQRLQRLCTFLKQFLPRFGSVSFHCCDNYGRAYDGAVYFAWNTWHESVVTRQFDGRGDGESYYPASLKDWLMFNFDLDFDECGFSRRRPFNSWNVLKIGLQKKIKGAA